MPPTSKSIEFVKGDTKQYELQFKEDGAAVDITDWTVYFTVKEHMEDADSAAKISISVSSFDDATSGKALIPLTVINTSIDVGQYYYSFDYKDDEGNQGVLLEGRLTVRRKVLQTRT